MTGDIKVSRKVLFEHTIMEKDQQPESLATVTIKPDYAPSEVYSSEPPPVSLFLLFLVKKTRVEISIMDETTNFVSSVCCELKANVWLSKTF